MPYELHLGDCLEIVRSIPSGSIDAIITDPPYPEVSRSYGRMTEPQWHMMMDSLVPEMKRVLKPDGSAMVLLQPGMGKLGSMRPWLWDFLSYCCRSWNVIQDHYVWNLCAPPKVGNDPAKRIARSSVKCCVWLGSPDCYRNEEAVLWQESDMNKACRLATRARVASGKAKMSDLYRSPSRHQSRNDLYEVAERRGGVTPFNLLPITKHVISTNKYGERIHAARTSPDIADWWTRYISRPGDTILDPFAGTATIGEVALKLGRNYVGIERNQEYLDVARRRLESVDDPNTLMRTLA